MRKKGLLGVFLIFLVLASLSFLQAQITNETEKVDKAYQCLSNLIEEKTCTSLSTEEKIFSLLALDKCEAEVTEYSSNEECWPAGDCKLKMTAQAVLALDNSNQNTDAAQNWLFSQNRTPPELVWYLQIESSEATTCSITYGGFSYENAVSIGEDKKITEKGLGSCLSLSDNGYWLEVSSSSTGNCYGKDFLISCDKDFKTNLLFQRQGSETIHVLGGESSSAGGETTEKVESFCFAQGGSCNYEGSLWAALVLNSLGKDISAYLPYLITLAEDKTNQRYLPYAFLYHITANEEYRASLLSEQINNKWWSASGDKYYDTAVALFPLQGETPTEKTNAKEWLIDTQEETGCWNSDNLRDTAFILFSVWPKDFAGSGGGGGVVPQSCEPDYYCVSSSSVCSEAGGSVLEGYSCPGISVCCSQEYEALTCSELEGNICVSPEICPSGNTISGVSGLRSGEVCCAVACQAAPSEGPGGGEDIGGNDVTPLAGEKKSYVWIWILSILIILVVLGIIYRDKLKKFLNKLKSKFKKKGEPEPAYRPKPPYYPPHYPRPRRILPARAPGRRVTPPQRRMPTRPKPKSSSELDEVLKKLKEMGK